MGSDGSPARATAPPAAGIARTQSPCGQATAQVPQKSAQEAAPRRWLVSALTALGRVLGSLQVAVLLLATFALVLTLGTFVESWYDSHIAQQLVYQTWWFLALLGLLALNIFFAAAKKWPWKRHQTGFLITHVGLLTLVAGGMVTALRGFHGSMALVDSEGEWARSFGPAQSSVIVNRARDVIRVERPSGTVTVVDFSPGPLPWNVERPITLKVGALTRFLHWLANPWPHGWSMTLDQAASLEVLAYHPYALHQPFALADEVQLGKHPREVFPALRVQLASPETGTLPREWLACHGEHRFFRRGPGLVEFLGHGCRDQQLVEFANPPRDAGPQGQLVIGLESETFRLDAERLGGPSPQPLGKSGWSVRITQFQPDYRQPGSKVLASPGLAVQLVRTDGVTASFATVARQAGELFPLPNTKMPWDALKGLWVWYHPPDPQYGDPSLKAVLQFVTSQDGGLHYRAFASARTGKFEFEKAGAAQEAGPRQSIWSGMKWKFQVADYLPRAVSGPDFVLVWRRPGQADPETVAALRCRLTVGNDSKDFWLGKSEHAVLPLIVAGQQFLVSYKSAHYHLNFSLKLLRAEQTTDIGSSQPASQSSFVLITDADQGLHDQPHVITLNQPLVHRGHRFYQSAYRALGTDPLGKPVSRSVLAVRHDPGLLFKYAGSTMLVLGIACMFYMKAYFFKYLKRSQT